MLDGASKVTSSSLQSVTYQTASDVNTTADVVVRLIRTAFFNTTPTYTPLILRARFWATWTADLKT